MPALAAYASGLMQRKTAMAARRVKRDRVICPSIVVPAERHAQILGHNSVPAPRRAIRNKLSYGWHMIALALS